MNETRSWLMLLSAVMLGAVVTAELRYGAIDVLAKAFGAPAAPSRASEPADAGLARRPAPRELVALNDLTDTRERPLFFEGRRLPESPIEQIDASPTAEPAKRTPTQPLGPVRLSAIVIVDDEAVALVREGGAGQSRKLRVGEDLNGWKVTEIHSTGITFRNGESDEKVELWTFESPAPPTRENSPGTAPRRAANQAAAEARAAAVRRAQELAKRRAAQRRGEAGAAPAPERGSRAASRPTPQSPSPKGGCGLSRC